MKRLLLFALVAFFGVSAQAQNKPTVITEKPAGTETVYKRVSGKMFFIKNQKISIADLAKLAENGQPAGDLTVVADADGKTCLSEICAFLCIIYKGRPSWWLGERY